MQLCMVIWMLKIKEVCSGNRFSMTEQECIQLMPREGQGIVNSFIPSFLFLKLSHLIVEVK